MKEFYEWIKSWSDCAPKDDLPRVLLIGDSITDGYSTAVRELLKGQFYVDSFATSYAVDSEIYQTLVKAFVKDNDYALVHYNHGLHGKHMSKELYKKGVEDCLQEINSSKIVLALTTEALTENNSSVDESWKDKISERNEVLKAISAKRGYGLNDLYELSTKLSLELRECDGVHFTKEGYKLFAEQVVENIKINMK